jgi:hypothetical protein
MKRVIGLILVLAACGIAFISLSGALPFISIFDPPDVIIVIIALVLTVLFLYRTGIHRGVSRLCHILLSPVLNEELKVNGELSRKIQAAEKKMDTTEQALIQFSSAIADYARNLASHTSAIQGLSQASQELRKGAAEQNRVLSAIMENAVKPVRDNEPLTTDKKIPEKTQEHESLSEKPAGTKIPPFHRALYKTNKIKPLYKVGKKTDLTVKLDLASEKSTASHIQPVPENESPIISAGKPKLHIEKPAAVPVQTEPKIERLVPLADRLVINARKSLQWLDENPSGSENSSVNHPVNASMPPGCARRHQEQLWY